MNNIECPLSICVDPYAGLAQFVFGKTPSQMAGKSHDLH